MSDPTMPRTTTTDPVHRLRQFRLDHHLSFYGLRELIRATTGYEIGYATLEQLLKRNPTRMPHETTRHTIETFLEAASKAGRRAGGE